MPKQHQDAYCSCFLNYLNCEVSWQTFAEAKYTFVPIGHQYSVKAQEKVFCEEGKCAGKRAM